MSKTSQVQIESSKPPQQQIVNGNFNMNGRLNSGSKAMPQKDPSQSKKMDEKLTYYQQNSNNGGGVATGQKKMLP